MPTVTVEGHVTLQQAATALRDRLGSHDNHVDRAGGQVLGGRQCAAS